MVPNPLDTDQAGIGATEPYRYVTNESTTVTVDSDGGADYESIQAAVLDVPKHVRHEYVIDVKDGHDESVGGNGHVRIQSIVHDDTSDGVEGFTADGEQGLLRIEVNQTTPSNCKVVSLSAFSCKGAQTPTIWGIQFQGAVNPDTDESVCALRGLRRRVRRRL